MQQFNLRLRNQRSVHWYDLSNEAFFQTRYREACQWKRLQWLL